MIETWNIKKFIYIYKYFLREIDLSYYKIGNLNHKYNK
jgi:hypothetical protein